MKAIHPLLKYILPVLAVSLLAGAALAALQPGAWWIGWLGFSALLFLGLAALAATWRWAGGGRGLAWMLALALLLRVAAGLGAYLALPVNGYDVPDDRAGYIFTDAHRRDDQAWQLAQSGGPLTAAFDKTYYTDQYGGLLAISAGTYRIFSPDAHRPLLIIVLAALVAALGIAFFLAVARLLWNDRLAWVAAWLAVLYPESVITGGAQMREPFLITFIAVALYGFARWLQERAPRSWAWVAAGLLGLLLVSPAIALGMLVLMGGWLWVRGERRRVAWPVVLAGLGALLLAILVLVYSLSRQHDFSAGSPLGVILNWVRHSVDWVNYELEHGSGQIQNVFSKMPRLAQFFFVIGYGIAQPVLPPAFFEPTTLTWHIIAILRAVGWYLVLPLLLFAPIAAWRAEKTPARRAWLWLSAFSWAWIVICAIRAGGDQWDNPRYRLIFFGLQAVLAGYGWVAWRETREAWLPRIIALEVVCILLFGQWYVARYYRIGIHLPIMVVLGLSLAALMAVFLGGWAWDRLRRRRQPNPTGDRV